MRTQVDLRLWYRSYQYRLGVADNLPSISAVAHRAGVHRDTIYALLAGDRINARSQYALSRVIEEIEAETAHVTLTRVMAVTLGAEGPRLMFGVGPNLLRQPPSAQKSSV